MQKALLLLAPFFALARSSCTPDAAPAPDAGPGITLTSQSYTLKPGEEDCYCYTMTLTEDTVMTGFVPHYGEAAHHLLFAQTLAPEPDGFSVCNVLFKVTWSPLFVGGVGASPLQLPPGTGMKLKKGTQLLLQLHLLNATAAPVSGTTGVTAETAPDPPAPVTPAGVWGIFATQINIPPLTNGFQESMQCAADKALDVFAVFGHMHRLGTHIKVTRN